MEKLKTAPFIFRAIKYPWKEKLSSKKIALVVGIIYICSLSCMTPTTLHVNYTKLKTVQLCTTSWATDTLFLYVIIWSILTEFLPLIAIIIAYTTMFLEIRKENLHLQPSQSDTQNTMRKLQLIKIQRKFMLIVGAFFFLTLPDCIVSILITYLAVYDPMHGFDKYRLPQNIFMFMAIFNSSINPLLYGEWRKLLLCKPSVGNQSSTPLMMRARTLQRK